MRKLGELRPYQRALLEERNALIASRKKLATFVFEDPDYKALSEMDELHLHMQNMIMGIYLAKLEDRIALFA